MAKLKVHYRNPALADAIAKQGLDDASVVYGWPGGELIGARQYGSLIRDTIDGIGPVYIKRYDYDRSILRYRLAGSRSYREWISSVRLAALGVAQPETVIVATRIDGWGVSGSFLITQEVPSARALEDLLDRDENPMDDELLAGLADALVGMIRRMHAGGFCHWDLKLRNVLVSRLDDDWLVVPIDAVNGRRMRLWNRRYCVGRDYRYLLRHPRLGPLIAARRAR